MLVDINQPFKKIGIASLSVSIEEQVPTIAKLIVLHTSIATLPPNLLGLSLGV